VPIYQTTSYLFDSTEHAGKLFALEEFGNIYTRIMNPTTDVFEQRIAALEGGAAALAVSSGQAAVVYAMLNLAKAGDHIVSSSSIYGGTYNAFAHTLKRFGIEVTLVDIANPAAVEAAIRPNTKALFAETIGNPAVDVFDVAAIAKAAHDAGVPLIVDNTLATPLGQRPFDLGADLSVPGAISDGSEDPAAERARLRVGPDYTAWLEQACDEVNASLQPLRSFVIPGGTPALSPIHI